MEKKNQHYVPQFYLRKFSADHDRIHVFDKFDKTVTYPRIKNTAAEYLFYNIPAESIRTGEVQSVEDTLGRMEQPYAEAISDLLREAATGRFTTGPTERNQWIGHFLAVQHCRTPSFRDSMGSVMQEITALWVENRNALARERVESGEIEAYEPLVAPKMELSPLEHAKMMLNGPVAREIYTWLFDHIWLIGDNQTSQPFYTSDDPVVYHGGNGPNPDAPAGFGTIGVEIYLPLSSRYILVLFDRRWFTPLLAKAKMIEGEVWKLKPEEVDYYNSYQVTQSRRFVFCRDDAFDVARLMMENSPENCDPNQPRFTVT
jgi:Protein of unknown function (DUF4238)